MSWSWYVYTTRVAGDVVAVDAELEAALEAYLEDHDVDDPLAEHGAGGQPPPKAADVIAYRARFGETLAPALLERLAECRTTFAFDYVRGEPADSPLQVSILRFVLERLAPCIMDWGDLSLELGESALAGLARFKSRGRLGPEPPPKPKALKRRAEKPGELRAVRIREKVATAAGDPDAALDLRASLAKLSEPARAYVVLLIEEGAMSDAAAKKKLGVSDALLAQAIDEVEAALA